MQYVPVLPLNQEILAVFKIRVQHIKMYNIWISSIFYTAMISSDFSLCCGNMEKNWNQNMDLQMLSVVMRF